MDDPPNFPIIIGVTGHRDIAVSAEAPVRASVRALLDDWRKQFRDALYVMTALADGADQLVADEAQEAGVPIIGIAPMPVAEYRDTLKNPRKFDEHWERAALRLILPQVTSDDKVPPHERQFEQLAVLLIRRSHLLLGLWDGTEDLTGRSGTGAVIRMRLEGDHQAATFRGSPMFLGAKSYLDVTNRGPLLHVFTTRQQATDPRAGTCSLLGLREEIPNEHDTGGVSDWSRIKVEPTEVLRTIKDQEITDFDRIKELNEMIVGFDRSEALIFKQQVDDLNVDGISGQARDAARILMRQQAGADAAAQVYQGRLLGHFVPAKSPWAMLVNGFKYWRRVKRRPRFGVVFAFSAAVPVAVFLFETYVEYWRELTGFLAILSYLIVVGGTTAHYKFRVRPQDWQGHFQDYRALAEAMRVQLYWAVAAIPAAASDHYLRKQSGELGWIQFALRGPALWAAALADTLETPSREAVATGWIDHQKRYFDAKWPLHRRADERGQCWTNVLVVFGFVASVLLLLLEFSVVCPWADRDWMAGPVELMRACHNYVVVSAATLPALAAFFSISREQRSYEPHAHSYALMRRMFRHAAGEAKKTSDSDPEFQELIRELGREALAENAEWLVGHRHRKIEQHA